MKAYLDIMRNILENGRPKKPVRFDANGIPIPVANGTIGTFAEIFRHDMSQGFPLLTTKKMAFKTLRVELEGFIQGITDKRWYQERGCKIWDEWCNPTQYDGYKDIELWQKRNPDLGPLGYSHGWRNFGGSYTPIPFVFTHLDKTIVIKNNDNEELVGKTIEGKYGNFTVISLDGKDKYHNKRYTIKFHDSGFVKNNLNSKQIIDANVFDPYYPNICNVACIGEINTTLDKSVIERLKNQWRQMIHRCYDQNHIAYNRYGKRGIYVANRWLIFSNFLEDVQLISGWSSKLHNWRSYQLDKDINQKGYYGPNSCLWVTVSNNTSNTIQNYFFDAVAPNGQEYKNIFGLSRFCKQHDLKTKNVEASIKNNTRTHNGWKFTRKDNLKTHNIIKGKDQLKTIVERLKENPYDRRMVCSAWNPNQISQMALPPCHFAWNVVVYENRLNLIWHQRSCDHFLGVPFNIASYGLLLLLLAKEGNLEPGELVGTLNDCHLYENQIEQAKLQLTRIPRKLPIVRIPDETWQGIFNWTHDQIIIEGYDPYPAIKAEVTVQ